MALLIILKSLLLLEFLILSKWKNRCTKKERYVSESERLKNNPEYKKLISLTVQAQEKVSNNTYRRTERVIR